MLSHGEPTLTEPTNPAVDYLQAASAIIERIQSTQLDAIEQAAQICARTITGGGLVHLFATGHSRMMIEEMFPRHGSFAGFHPIVELSLTYHTPVVGANGQRQAMFLEHVEGFAPVILRNFVLQPPDSFMIFSNSGVNEVVVEMAREVKKRGLPLIAVMGLLGRLLGKTTEVQRHVDEYFATRPGLQELTNGVAARGAEANSGSL